MEGRKGKKNKRNSVIIAILLGLTIGSSIFVGYSTFLWISVAQFYHNLQSSITINEVQIAAKNESYLMNVTVSIRNELAYSHVNMYIALEKIIIHNNIISLDDPYEGLPPSAFTRVKVPQQSNVSVKFSLTLPKNFPKIEDSVEMKFVIRVLATTIINEGQPQTAIIIKSAQTVTIFRR
ncbi:MAG: hypothetical protein QW175_01765 [Candidatus Bathyarchaeia archaeon]